jgi:nucleoid-associated protein YgaU
MAVSRYRKSLPLQGKFLYKINKKTKKKKNIVFYNSLSFEPITDDNLDSLEVEEITFKPTDTLMGLSQKFYNDPSYWWVIAMINNVGSERDIEPGQTLAILTPLSTLLPELGL